MSKQDPYGIFGAQIDASASFWAWCDECQASMPSNHVCGKTQITSTSDEDMMENIDYWSVEAVLRGWHGVGMQHEARRRVKDGTYDASQTKNTRYGCY